MSEKLSRAMNWLQQMSDKEFMETYFQIVNKDRQEVPFILNGVQINLEANWGDWNVVLKYRKPGVSVHAQNKLLSRCIRRKNRNAVVLSYDKDSTQRMLERTAWTLNHVPWEVPLGRESKQEFQFKETNSKFWIGTAGSRAFGRGDDITDLHISEYAFWENPKLITGIMEALTNDAFVVVESTANGPANDYARLYRKGKTGATKWKSHFFPWWLDPNLMLPLPPGFVHTDEEKVLKATYDLIDEQLAWRRAKIADMIEPELFPQEYPANDQEAFLVLGDCVFNRKALNTYESLAKETEAVGYLLPA